MEEYRERYLKDLQREANRYMRFARNAIKEGKADGYTERAYLNAQNRLRMFQTKQGLRKYYQFSMKGVEDDDAYENILKSVTENVRLNPEKAAAHRESQIQFYQDQGWASNRKGAEAMYDFKSTSAFETLMEKNLGDIPSELLTRYGEFVDADYSVADFEKMIVSFEKDLKLNNYYESYDDFISYTDRYIKNMKMRDDFKKGVEEYLNYKGDEYASLFDFLEDF